jgi:hypothetical protein
LLRALYPLEAPIRLIGLTLSSLGEDADDPAPTLFDALP